MQVLNDQALGLCRVRIASPRQEMPDPLRRAQSVAGALAAHASLAALLILLGRAALRPPNEEPPALTMVFAPPAVPPQPAAAPPTPAPPSPTQPEVNPFPPMLALPEPLPAAPPPTQPAPKPAVPIPTPQPKPDRGPRRCVRRNPSSARAPHGSCPSPKHAPRCSLHQSRRPPSSRPGHQRRLIRKPRRSPLPREWPAGAARSPLGCKRTRVIRRWRGKRVIRGAW